VLRGGVRAREVCVRRGVGVLERIARASGVGCVLVCRGGHAPATATTTMATTTTATTEATCLCRSAASLPNERTDRADLPQAAP